jgi:hypothetical protein
MISSLSLSVESGHVMSWRYLIASSFKPWNGLGVAKSSRIRVGTGDLPHARRNKAAISAGV